MTSGELAKMTNTQLAAMAKDATELLERRINPSTGGWDDSHHPPDDVVYAAYHSCLAMHRRVLNKHETTNYAE